MNIIIRGGVYTKKRLEVSESRITIINMIFSTVAIKDPEKGKLFKLLCNNGLVHLKEPFWGVAIDVDLTMYPKIFLRKQPIKITLFYENDECYHMQNLVFEAQDTLVTHTIRGDVGSYIKNNPYSCVGYYAKGLLLFDKYLETRNSWDAVNSHSAFEKAQKFSLRRNDSIKSKIEGYLSVTRLLSYPSKRLPGYNNIGGYCDYFGCLKQWAASPTDNSCHLFYALHAEGARKTDALINAAFRDMLSPPADISPEDFYDYGKAIVNNKFNTFFESLIRYNAKCLEELEVTEETFDVFQRLKEVELSSFEKDEHISTYKKIIEKLTDYCLFYHKYVPMNPNALWLVKRARLVGASYFEIGEDEAAEIFDENKDKIHFSKKEVQLIKRHLSSSDGTLVNNIYKVEPQNVYSRKIKFTFAGYTRHIESVYFTDTDNYYFLPEPPLMLYDEGIFRLEFSTELTAKDSMCVYSNKTDYAGEMGFIRLYATAVNGSISSIDYVDYLIKTQHEHAVFAPDVYRNVLEKLFERQPKRHSAIAFEQLRDNLSLINEKILYLDKCEQLEYIIRKIVENCMFLDENVFCALAEKKLLQNNADMRGYCEKALLNQGYYINETIFDYLYEEYASLEGNFTEDAVNVLDRLTILSRSRFGKNKVDFLTLLLRLKTGKFDSSFYIKFIDLYNNGELEERMAKECAEATVREEAATPDLLDVLERIGEKDVDILDYVNAQRIVMGIGTPVFAPELVKYYQEGKGTRHRKLFPYLLEKDDPSDDKLSLMLLKLQGGAQDKDFSINIDFFLRNFAKFDKDTKVKISTIYAGRRDSKYIHILKYFINYALGTGELLFFAYKEIVLSSNFWQNSQRLYDTLNIIFNMDKQICPQHEIETILWAVAKKNEEVVRRTLDDNIMNKDKLYIDTLKRRILKEDG
ncbi:hypothetical protein AGMMS49975_15810 [Clostridia bacterium]|nr:hypothetical protein AGMMS49975_15810 [Clostridia bacterium]